MSHKHSSGVGPDKETLVLLQKAPLDLVLFFVIRVFFSKVALQKDICTPRFIAALFTVARTWKQTKCPMTDDWLKKLWYMYTVEYISTVRDEILPFATT